VTTSVLSTLEDGEAYLKPARASLNLQSDHVAGAARVNIHFQPSGILHDFFVHAENKITDLEIGQAGQRLRLDVRDDDSPLLGRPRPLARMLLTVWMPIQSRLRRTKP